MINLIEYNKAQYKEIENYIWCLGVELGHDPTIDKSRGELELEWISKFSVLFAVNNRIKFQKIEQTV
jgi:hypothetical protein